MEYLDAALTPTFVYFKDAMGRTWQALALLAPLTTEDMDPVVIADTADLELKFQKIKLIRRK